MLASHGAKLTRVLYVTGRIYPSILGGTANVQYFLTSHLSNLEGVKLTLMGTYPWAGGDYTSFYPPQLRLKIFRTLGPNRSFGDVALANLHYLSSLTESDYGIVHFNVLPGLRAGSFFSLIKARNIKSIVTVHDIPQELAFWDRGHLDKTLSRLHWTIAMRQLCSADVVIVNSEFVKSKLAGFIGADKLVVIPNGIPKQLLLMPPIHSTMNIVCHGTISPMKGQLLLAKAFANMPNRESFKLTFVGGGESRHISELKRFVQRSGLDSSVDVIGPLPRSNVLDIVSRAAFCVIPSLWEGFGISALEALALGKPVIATRFGLSELITNDVEGILVDPTSTSEFTRALDRLCSDSELRRRMGRNGRLKARNYTWDDIAIRYAHLYASLLD